MLPIILTMLLLPLAEDRPGPGVTPLPAPVLPAPPLPAPPNSQPTRIKDDDDGDPLEDHVRACLPYFLSWGIVPDVDCWAAIGAPGAASIPQELLQALQSKDRKTRASAVGQFRLLASMAQTSAWIDGKSDGARRFRLSLGRLACSYERALTDCLQDDTPEIRFGAATALLVLEPKHRKALQAVVANLKNMTPEFLEAVGPLRFTQDEIMLCLVNALAHEEAEVRKAAAKSVIEIGLPARAAIPGLIKMLKSNDAIDHDYAPWPPIGQRRVNLAVEALKVMASQAAPAVPALIDLLKICEHEDRADILVCLARIGPAARQAVLPVRRLLADYHQHPGPRFLPVFAPELDVRLTAACTLLRILPNDHEALTVLKDSLRAADKNLRRLALEACALTGLKQKALVPDFIRALKDEELQEAAAYALAEVGPDAAEAIPVLQEILTNERCQCSEHHNPATALAKTGKAGLPALIAVAQQRGSEARSAALLPLSSFEEETPRTLPILMNALFDQESRFMAAVALGKLGSRARDAKLPLLAVHFLDLVGTSLDLLGTSEHLLVVERWALTQISHEASKLSTKADSIDTEIRMLLDTISDDPDLIHADYTPSVHRLIEIGEPALPTLDLLLAEDPVTRSTPRPRSTVLHAGCTDLSPATAGPARMVKRNGEHFGPTWAASTGKHRRNNAWPASPDGKKTGRSGNPDADDLPHSRCRLSDYSSSAA
jgi:HEAT repeat protein